MKQCAIYLRVSTQKQNISHLGLESQMQICESYIKETDGQLVKVFQDVQSGKSKDRKGLLDAIEFCKKNKCELVFAKLDRLARDVEFTFKVVNTGIQVHFCDMPQLNTLILGVMATVAQYERELISQRTKQALAAKKARGCKLGRTSGADVQEMCAASATARREKARNNPTNKIIWGVLSQYTDGGTRMPSTDEYERVCLTLSGMGVTTSTGLPFNVSRARNAYHNLKRIFDGYHGLRFNVSKLCY